MDGEEVLQNMKDQLIKVNSGLIEKAIQRIRRKGTCLINPKKAKGPNGFLFAWMEKQQKIKKLQGADILCKMRALFLKKKEICKPEKGNCRPKAIINGHTKVIENIVVERVNETEYDY